MKVAVIGAGVSGVFCAVNLKRMLPEADVEIYEASKRPLYKLSLTGGGRCNITNDFSFVKSLSEVYPRGERLMKQAFYTFSYKDIVAWFEREGLPLVTQGEGRVFPESEDAMDVVRLLLRLAEKENIRIRTSCRLSSITRKDDGGFLMDFDGVKQQCDMAVISVGGINRFFADSVLAPLGVNVEEPVPSLFSLDINDAALRALAGVSVQNSSLLFAGTKSRSVGPVIITHHGISGPAVLRLSSYAARWLKENNYHAQLIVSWTGENEEVTKEKLLSFISSNANKQAGNIIMEGLPSRLMDYLLQRAGTDSAKRLRDMGRKEIQKLVSCICCDTYQTQGKGKYKDEFVTSGGVKLSEVNAKTLEHKTILGLYFTGECLDIDGVTGGYNLQAAWTTGFMAAKGIADRYGK